MARTDVQLMLDVKAGDEQSFALLLHRYRTPLVNFLYRMVRNREQAEDLAQEVFIRVYRARAEEGDERPLDVAEKNPNIEEHLVQEAQREMIRHAIDKLPEKQRAAVLLHKYQELDYGEISKILSCSESALKSLLFRAYETLRVELAPLVALRAKS